jgi:hypothetical protein
VVAKVDSGWWWIVVAVMVDSSRGEGQKKTNLLKSLRTNT